MRAVLTSSQSQAHTGLLASIRPPAPIPKLYLRAAEPSNTPILPHSPQPRLPAVTLLLLGLSGFTNSLALFWLLLVLTLQRGPITPCDEELSPIRDSGVKAAAIAALLLPLLVLLPYPAAVSFTGGLPDLPPTF